MWKIHDPGLEKIFGTGTGTVYFLIRDQDFYESRLCPGFMNTREVEFQIPGLRPVLRFVWRGIPGLNYLGPKSRGPKKSGTRSRGLKIFRDTVPVPCQHFQLPKNSVLGTRNILGLSPGPVSLCLMQKFDFKLKERIFKSWSVVLEKCLARVNHDLWLMRLLNF